ncbi:MAG: FliO/MopB family protein [Cellulosilyticaceae bacterium]
MPSQGLGLILELIMLMGIFIGVLFLAYLVTKKMALVKQGGFSQKNMKVIEYLAIGQGQSLCIVQIGEAYHVFSVTKDRITHCFELEEQNLKIEQQEDGQFQNYLSRWVKEKQEKAHDKTK